MSNSSAVVLVAVLGEMVRRGGDRWTSFLREELASHDGKGFAFDNRVLLLEAALIRIKGDKDRIRLAMRTAGPVTVTFPEMPSIMVAVINQDPAKRNLTWRRGGNYRHGRAESWGFQVTDVDGRIMPILDIHEFAGGMMGGLSQQHTLKHGAEFEREVRLGAYTHTLPPGRYNVRAAYAFNANMGSVADKTKALAFLSNPVELVVKPRTILLTEDEMRTARELCAALEWKTLPIVFDMYYNRKEERQPIVVPDDSAIRKLLSMKWKAVPALIDELKDDALPPRKRAWLFAMLWGLTTDNAPVAGLGWGDRYHVLIDYHVIDQFSKGGIIDDIKAGKQVNLEPRSSSIYNKLSKKNQRKLANAWLAWKDYIVVQVQD